MNKHIATITSIIIISLLVAGYFYWSKIRTEEETPPSTETILNETEQALEDITNTQEVEVPTSPLQGATPELNPVGKTNPFNIYKNPFE
ncbi:MAG: hypothetical protein A2586_03090 [Candidatus Harrisonbacteria bacterium RIFOXYD1_FULL_40_9]|uniref:Uncharacterized protein n=1 Tax=Candidatus Harrisonbacteria bacterium RIFOXYD1_FULL_40_9 TaxID=1798412 RepID=A0A1G1ZXH9_9BACT|nr:MAG: hypothetical protein A2586_03090 [Candidatus Harrisonbacteria bacterium RIFOXYD1_FULL_40_9]